MLTVHHLNDSRSQRVLWLLEELGVEYDIVFYERAPETMRAPASLKQVHPLGKSPVLTDSGLTVAETGAVMEYILATYGNGQLQLSVSHPHYWQYRHWLYYAEGSAMPPLLIKLLFSTAEEKAPALVRPLVKGILSKLDAAFSAPESQLHADYWEATLQKHTWFAGDEMTVADIMMSFPIEAGVARIGYEDRPLLRAFLERIHARPAYQQALERGGEYKLAAAD